MSGRRRGGDDDRFVDAVSDVRPLADRDKERPEPKPAARAPGPRRPAPRFVSEREGEGRRDDLAAKTLARLRRGAPAPERDVDLHGLDARSAQRHLAAELPRARNAGLRCLRVIHGRGLHSESGPVLRERLPEWLSQPPLADAVLAFARDAGARDAGGSTLVLLKRPGRTP